MEKIEKFWYECKCGNEKLIRTGKSKKCPKCEKKMTPLQF